MGKKSKLQAWIESQEGRDAIKQRLNEVKKHIKERRRRRQDGASRPRKRVTL